MKKSKKVNQPTKQKKEKHVLTKEDSSKGGTNKRIFKTEDELWDKFCEYVNYCVSGTRVVNVAGFCRFCGIFRDIYYDYTSRYPNAIKKINDVIEDEALNNPLMNATLKIFYLKNKFPEIYKDRQELDVTNRDIVYESEDING